MGRDAVATRPPSGDINHESKERERLTVIVGVTAAERVGVGRRQNERIGTRYQAEETREPRYDSGVLPAVRN